MKNPLYCFIIVGMTLLISCQRLLGADKQVDRPLRYEEPVLLTNQPEQIIEHLGYTVSYNHAWHLPNWVAYELTHVEVQGESSRTDKFLPDPQVQGDPVVTRDYKGSGYDRGHMAPAADLL